MTALSSGEGLGSGFYPHYLELAMQKLPTIFISHGAPTYALEPGPAGAQLTTLGQTLPKPKAVLVVSPHWMTPDVRVGTALRPETIHDFGGFSPVLYQLRYPVAGDRHFSARAQSLLRAAGWSVAPDDKRGLDHGAWVPLCHLYPLADVPTFQVSMPQGLDGATAYAFGQSLAPLSEEGVLIVGSGSLTHNLYEFRSRNGQEPAYAREFVAWVRDTVSSGDRRRLLQTLELAPHAQRAHPTSEHFLPLVVAAGAADGVDGQPIEADVLDGGFTHGVLSMESYVFNGQTSDTAALESMKAANV
ncbi:DODA-type extradiol aromatic ring-opening family dioxygenase [Variovorax sp. N23]|uniref:DODA-type extradiol aromatic ring-opening family dioxygenase n=1 Tax=Variovorax sp. N23 TaxID=2980555 RepID=UPI0021C60324|nr:class III extradiol ring-cleavage dioxygenase [Variovorax sp. N23]MCU4118946.1 dioxygenase [Variovorax sp. N23]